MGGRLPDKKNEAFNTIIGKYPSLFEWGDKVWYEMLAKLGEFLETKNKRPS